MPSPILPPVPGLTSFLLHLKSNPGPQGLESSIEQFISLLKRRQIRNSRPCAIATTQILIRVVAAFKGRDVAQLMARIRHIGQRLTAAQPKEMAVGNIVRRVLGLVREICEEEQSDDSPSMSAPSSPPSKSLPRPSLKTAISTFSPLKGAAIEPADMVQRQEDSPPQTSQGAPPSQRPKLSTANTSYAASAPAIGSLFGIFSNPQAPSPTSSTPLEASGHPSPSIKPMPIDLGDLSLVDKSSSKDIKADIIDGIKEIADEIDQCADQIAGYSLDHIHADEIVLTHGMSLTIQKFLLTAARKRRFTVVLVESETDGPSILAKSRATGAGDDEESDEESDKGDPLTALNHKNLNIIVIPHSAVFAIMSRINKVLLATHAVLANGGLVASVGAYNIAQAAKVHQVPVVVLSGVYKLSPTYPFNIDELVEWSDAGKVGEGLAGGVEVSNPVKEYVPEGLVELYITNLGGHAPTYLYRIVQDHYHIADVNLESEP